MTVSITEHGRDERAAVDKAISLLVSFGNHGSAGVGVTELARRARLSKSTAFRVLGMLERNGVVERVGRNYRLGARLHELGRTVYAPDHDRVRDLLIPFLTDLYELTRETVHVAALHGSEVVYLAKLHGHRPATAPPRIGERMPAYCSAVGKVLLAYDPDAAAGTLSATLRGFTANTITDPAVLAAELATIRRDGIGYDDEESQAGLSCVAVPVLSRTGRAVAAFSVAGPTDRIDKRRLGAHLRRVSAAATRVLSGALLGVPEPRALRA